MRVTWHKAQAVSRTDSTRANKASVRGALSLRVHV